MLKFKFLLQSDTSILFKIYSDKEAMRFRGSRRGVELEESGELIGSVMFRYDDMKDGICEIGYSIGKQYWGKGFGTEIVKEILKTLQKEQRIHTAIAWSHKENISSIKILERLGFTRTPQKESDVNDLFVKQLA